MADIRNRETSSFTTPRPAYDALNDCEARTINMVKYFTNSLPIAVWWHNGLEDATCEFHGLHLHMIAFVQNGNRSVLLHQITKYRNMKAHLKSQDIDVRCQAVKSLKALSIHLMKPPRVLVGCNNLSYNQVLKGVLHNAHDTIGKYTTEDEAEWTRGTEQSN